MPGKTQDSTLKDLDKLLHAVRENAATLTGIEPFRDALENAYERAQANLAIRNAMRRSAREATRLTNHSLAAARDAATRVRDIVRGVFGPRSEKLPQFGIKIPRKRSPKSKKPPLGFERPS